MNILSRKTVIALALATGVASPAWSDDPGLELMQAIEIARAEDPWLDGSQYTQEALEAEARSARTLPDPRMSVMLANMPTDTFNFGQEPMTQFAVGITQMLPRGDSLKLMGQMKQQLSSQEPLLRADREGKVAVTVSQLWLDAYKAQQTIALIEQDRALFEQLVDVAMAGYSSALGKSSQKDVIRAQLELTGLEDRLAMLGQQMGASKQRLSEWVGGIAVAKPLSRKLPELELAMTERVTGSATLSQQEMYELFQHHPALLALEVQIEAAETGSDLARQKYKPEWGVTAQYGYRDDDPMGQSRSDFLSLGVSFDLPIFTANRQDKDVDAAVARANQTKTQRRLLLRQLLSAFETSRSQLLSLDERQALYVTQLLPQMSEQSEASLSAYNNDYGDFAEAVRARIAELNAKIEMLNIQVERQKQIAQINYLLIDSRNTLSGGDQGLSGANDE